MFVKKKEEKKCTALVGIDMSLRSPGIAVYLTDSDKWELYGFAQNKSQKGLFKQVSHNATVTLLDRIPSKKKACDMVRYKHIVDNIMKHCILKYDVTNIKIEEYVFDHKHSAFSHKLHEVCGILKFVIHNAGITNVQSVLCNQWKKALTGHGDADKKDVLDYIKFNYPFIDVMGDFKIGKDRHIPNPWQDLSDAIGIACFDESKLQEVKKSKRKRKIGHKKTKTKKQKVEEKVLIEPTNLWFC